MSEQLQIQTQFINSDSKDNNFTATKPKRPLKPSSKYNSDTKAPPFKVHYCFSYYPILELFGYLPFSYKLTISNINAFVYMCSGTYFYNHVILFFFKSVILPLNVNLCCIICNEKERFEFLQCA